MSCGIDRVAPGFDARVSCILPVEYPLAPRANILGCATCNMLRSLTPKLNYLALYLALLGVMSSPSWIQGTELRF